MTDERDLIQQRLGREQGTIRRRAARSVALVYPSPYRVGMSSLGFQTVYRRINALPDWSAERAFLVDEGARPTPTFVTYESGRAVGAANVVAFSIAYELELPGFFACLERAQIPVLRTERRPSDPWVVAGGPLTFSNPEPLGPFVDAVVMGEGEGIIERVLEALADHPDRPTGLRRLADLDHVWVPDHHGGHLPAMGKAAPADVPAYSAILTPDTELRDMFLVEPERGCSRGCTFCVMRRSTNGGMRLVAPSEVLALVPPEARRVGLVGAAVSDHPRIVPLVEALVDSGREVGLSSFRADRLTDAFVRAIVRGGYRTLTVASDGASERLRASMDKHIREKHLRRAAELCAEHHMPQLKLYMMVGVPDERDEDIEELIAFTLELAALAGKHTKLALGIAPFVAKRNTPLDGHPFVGIKTVDARLKRLRKGLVPRVDVRPTSARWAWVEYMLAQGDADAGLAAYEAHRSGGTFAAWKRAFDHRGPPARLIARAA